MISKELLSEVLDDKKILLSKNDLLIGDNVLLFDNQCNYLVNINIHELAHKCKVWAFDKGYEIESSLFVDANKKKIGYSQILREEASIRQMIADTEPEAIFKACEWILKEKQ